MRFFKREYQITNHTLQDSLQPFLLFMLLTALFPFGFALDDNLLTAVGPGLIWSAFLLAILLQAPAFFADDYEQGVLAQWCLQSQLHTNSVQNTDLHAAISAKLLAQTLLLIVPIICALPLVAVWYQLSFDVIKALVASFFLGGPTLCLIAALGSALTLAAKRQSVRLLLVIMPLYVPVFIVGAQTVQLVANGHAMFGTLAILAAMLIFCVMLVPLVLKRLILLAVEAQ